MLASVGMSFRYSGAAKDIKRPSVWKRSSGAFGRRFATDPWATCRTAGSQCLWPGQGSIAFGGLGRRAFRRGKAAMTLLRLFFCIKVALLALIVAPQAFA